MATFLVKK